jgi:hypothetical protein
MDKGESPDYSATRAPAAIVETIQLILSASIVGLETLCLVLVAFARCRVDVGAGPEGCFP